MGFLDESINKAITAPGIPTPSASTTGGLSVSSDKIFSNVSSSKATANVFGIFDTKQVVRELSADTNSAFSTEMLADLDPDKITNLAKKMGTDIASDISFESAVAAVTSKLSDVKQQAFSLSDGIFGDVTTLATSAGTSLSATLGDVLDSGTFSLDALTSSMIPESMTSMDFDSLKSIFNGDVGSLNSCDVLADILSWAKGLFSKMNIFDQLMKLFGLVGKYDLGGFIQCVKDAMGSLDAAKTSELSDVLIDNGSVQGFSELMDITNHGTVLDKFSAVRSLAKNSSATDVNTSMDSIFGSLNIDKADVFTANSQNITSNDSILSSMSDPVYDASLTASSKGTFVDHCLGSVGKLVSAVPSFS